MLSFTAARAPRPRRAALGALLAGCLAILGCGGDDDKSGPTASRPEDFLPNDVQGWEEMAGTRETATTVPELQATVVDGGYQPYEFYGFQDFAHAVYQGSVQGSPASLDAQITELSSATQATAMYDDTQYGIRPPTSEPVTPAVGDASRLARSLTTLTLDFVDGVYWVKLFINDTSDDGLSVLQAFAASIAEEMP